MSSSRASPPATEADILPTASFDAKDARIEMSGLDIEREKALATVIDTPKSAVLRAMRIREEPVDESRIRIVDTVVNTMTVTLAFENADAGAPPFRVDTAAVPGTAAPFLDRFPDLVAVITTKTKIVRRDYAAHVFKPFKPSVQIVFEDEVTKKLRFVSCYESGNVMCVGVTSFERAQDYGRRANEIVAAAMGRDPKTLVCRHRFDLINCNFLLSRSIDAEAMSEILSNVVRVPVLHVVKNNIIKFFVIYRLDCEHGTHRFKNKLEFFCDCRFITMTVYAESKKICISGNKSFLQVAYAIAFLEEIVFARHSARLASKRYSVDNVLNVYAESDREAKKKQAE